MTPSDFYGYELELLHSLAPPVEAFGVGGSSGAGRQDGLSDLDFFLLVPDASFFAFVKEFPQLVRHPWPPLAWRRRGFVPDFGFQFSVVYPNLYSVDYHVNCHSSLLRTPMARKTRVIFDATGAFTEFHRTLPIDSDPSSEAAAELLIELLRLHKYARRRELLSAMHRLERLRLVLLGLERYLRYGEPYVPHDADKWVRRDLDKQVCVELARTFSDFRGSAVSLAFQSLYQGVAARLNEVAGQSAEYKAAVDSLAAEIAAGLGAIPDPGDAPDGER